MGDLIESVALRLVALWLALELAFEGYNSHPLIKLTLIFRIFHTFMSSGCLTARQVPSKMFSNLLQVDFNLPECSISVNLWKGQVLYTVYTLPPWLWRNYGPWLHCSVTHDLTKWREVSGQILSGQTLYFHSGLVSTVAFPLPATAAPDVAS